MANRFSRKVRGLGAPAAKRSSGGSAGASLLVDAMPAVAAGLECGGCPADGGNGQTTPRCASPPSTDRDTLTGLPGRGALRDVMARRDGRPVSRARRLVMLVIGIDRLRRVNDHIDFGAGDDLLRAMGERIARVAADTVIVARLGADEFAVLQETAAHERSGAQIARCVLGAVSTPVSVAGEELFCTCSIGICERVATTCDIDALTENARAALHSAKSMGGNQFRFYDAASCETDAEALRLETALHRALDNDEIEAHFQPQVEVGTQRIVSAEALARWTHPRFGRVSPERFIPIAECSDLIQSLGERVLRSACHRYAEWSRSDAPLLQVSVNLSPCQIERPGLTGRIRRILDECGMAPQSLELEITETTLIKDCDVTARVIHELKDLGVRLALDDFGTGYSSLYHLHRFPIDTLKIDRSFIAGLARNIKTRVIVASMIDMAHRLGLVVVAEGVRTAHEAAILARYGCDRIQGNYYSAARDAVGMSGLIRDHATVSGAAEVP